MWQCHYCRHPLSLDVLLKNRLCPSCGSDIHCCKNCLHYDEELASKCHEPNSPWVRDRNTANHCAFFEHRPAVSGDEPKAAERSAEAERAKEAFRALFRTP